MRLPTLSLLLLTAGFSISTQDRATASPPNILFIFCDDLTRQAVSAYGHELKLLETPNMDRLAKEGMLFQRCVVPNSICGPSRAVIQTGKYSHMNGFYRNWNRFDGSQQTFPKLMQAGGYQTAVIGKWHLTSDPVGFDHWHILPGQGQYYNPPMIRDGENVTHEGYTTDLIAEFSMEWIRKRDKNKPFVLMSQHKAPHGEWAPALRHLGWSGDRVFPEPATLFDDYSGRGRPEKEQTMTFAKIFTAKDAKLETPEYLTPEQRQKWQAYYEPLNDTFRAAKMSEEDRVKWNYQRFMHDYLATVIAVDEAVGKLLQCLEEEGIADNTMVVLSSDQGFFLGEHGWCNKRWIYEESLTTPLIVRWPGVVSPGSREMAMVSIIDFPETFLEAGGLPVPPDMQGRSLVPMLKGATPEDWRTSFYYHYYEYPSLGSVRRHYGVVTDRYKLFHFYEPDVNEWRLMDRQTDPHELKDVYSDPAYAEIVNELKEELHRLRTELKVPEIDPPDSIRRPSP